ncbi:Di-copper centre-containing protein [Thozetella sp. PMI_491]|nr:Di-copper centre-containing protein [Thozetella sp. PMI_491]
MLPIVVLSWACLALAQHGAYDYGLDILGVFKRQALPQQVVVKGVSASADGSLPVRREIRELQADGDQWTLFLLGLNMMQFTNQSDPTSWYGLTGIHGVPFQSWGGVGPTAGNERSGYCTHISVLFPTWHRPYLALYEQVLYDTIQNIAMAWPAGAQRTRFQDAAAKFRIPYWDWATAPPAGQSVLPQSITGQSYVDVDGPNGMQRIANPLFRYIFRPLDPNSFIQSPFTDWPSTLRAPTTGDSSAQSNNTAVAGSLDQNRAVIEQRLYNLFANYDDYSMFSNEGWINQSNSLAYDSIESLHDTIHNIAGGFTGHMSYIPFSAFDPIFFLHHANVDRIFAMWQVLYPNSWILPTPAAMSSYTTSRGEEQDSNTALTPFFSDDKGNFWTSDMVRDHRIFGYTYNDVGDSGSTNKSQVIATINRLYSQSSPSGIALRAKGLNTRALQTAQVFAGDQYREWIVNIRVEKQALRGPFSIHLFLGSPPPDTRTWPSAQNLVGTMSVFAAPSSDTMYTTSGPTITGTVPLTAALVNRAAAGSLHSLSPDDIIPILKNSLHCHVLSNRGMEVDQISSLKVDVVSYVVQAPSHINELPKWGAADTCFSVR